MRKCLFVALAVGLACAGCNRRNGLYPVSGTLTCNGAPAEGAMVFFLQRGAAGIAAFKGESIMGAVQKDGSFKVFCGGLGEGAPPGEYNVVVEWKYHPELPPARSPQEGRARPDRLKGRYADPARPLLQAVVKPQSNRLPPFELTD